MAMEGSFKRVQFYTHNGIINSSSFVVAVEYMNARVSIHIKISIDFPLKFLCFELTQNQLNSTGV